MKYRHIYIYIGCLLSLGCSTKNNTFLSRSYHNLTARYNVYFNGNESYKKGTKRMYASLKDDYTSLLPIFPFPNAESQNSAPAEMERAIKKASKTIATHSITAKPNFKKGIKTKRQKELFNKREYNMYIDDAYLLIGKASLMKGDLFSATGALRQILKEYPKENSYTEAQITLVRTLVLNEEYSEAEEILTKLAKDKKLPRKYISYLNATYADFLVHRKQIPEAIEKLEIAAKKARTKQLRLRYTFILGQLYESTGNNAKATEKYLKVIKMSPPYEMTFNARVNLAGAFESGLQNADNIKKQLYKLLRDEKNKEYNDQIYFALGNIDMKEGNKDRAIVNYSLSANKSVSNQRQKARSYLAIADIKYNDRDYLAAQAYYDSAVTNLDEAFPDYAKINARARSLTRLADNLNAVSFEDSVQFIAKMSENERNLFIDQIIAKVKEREADEKRKMQEEANQQQQNFASANEMQYRNNNTNNQAGEGSKWYFYNPSAKSYGTTEFQVKWGKRKLEDNWRRSNKKTTGAQAESDENTEADGSDKVKKKKLDNKTREYYSENLPLTDSAIIVSHERIRKSLFNAGNIYRDELAEYKLAARQYDEIIKRYPDNVLVADAAYQQYILYRQTDNMAKADEYKSLLLTKFPESVYARLLTNPNFLKELQEKENEVENIYTTAYNAYNNADYSATYNIASKAIVDFPNNKLKPKFNLLAALSKGKLYTVDTMRVELNKIIKENPKSEEATAAHDIIALMDVQHPEYKEKEETIIAKEIYKSVLETDKHFFVFVLNPKQGNQNQLVFNLLNYNLDNYTNANLTAKSEPIGGTNQMVVVKAFKTKSEALNYFDATLKDPAVLKDAGTVLAGFVISESNFNIFKQDGSESRYVIFFKENYKR